MSKTLTYFKALSDSTRLRLLHVLSHYELSVNELVSLLDMGQSRISRHLKILSTAGLITARRDGLWVFYKLTSKGEGRNFLDAVTPFFNIDSTMHADLNMALSIIEERARKTRQFFNAIADNWDELNREVLAGFDLAQRVCSAIPKDCAVAVDLGCGTGSVLEYLQPYAKNLIGVDGSPRMLELARRRLFARINESSSNISLRIGELDHLPLRNNEADFASLNLVLHHVADPNIVIAEIARILKPGSTLFLADFDQHKLENMREEYNDFWLGFSKAELEKLLHANGFSLGKCEAVHLDNGLKLHCIIATFTKKQENLIF